MKPNPQFSMDLVTFTEEIFNGIFHFLCSENDKKQCAERPQQNLASYVQISWKALQLQSFLIYLANYF